MQSMANPMTMLPGGYDMSHNSQWSILVASCKTSKPHHKASACAVLAWQTMVVGVFVLSNKNTTAQPQLVEF